MYVYIGDVAHIIEMFDRIFPAQIKTQLQSYAEKLEDHIDKDTYSSH